MVSQALMLDSEKGELVKAPARIGKKGISEAKDLGALKSHSEAERRRRERINSHLATLRGLVPCAEKVTLTYEGISLWYVTASKCMWLTACNFACISSQSHMDKATLLAAVISEIKELRKNALEACEGLLVPMDDDEVKVETFFDGTEDGTLYFKASICCDYRPELLSDIRNAIDALPLKMMNAEISTLGSRLKTEFIFTDRRDKNASEDAEAIQILTDSIHQTLTSVLEKGSASPEYSPWTTLPNKRMRSMASKAFWNGLVAGFYAPCSHSRVSNHLTLLTESLPTDENDQSSMPAIIRGNRNRCPVPGTLYNKNTLEAFHAPDKRSLLKEEANKAKSASAAARNDWRNSSLSADMPLFLISIASNSHATIRHLKDWEACWADNQKFFLLLLAAANCFYDPSHRKDPGWPLLNFLGLICSRCNMKRIHFLCYRGNRGFADMESSLVIEALITAPQGLNDWQIVANAVGCICCRFEYKTNEMACFAIPNLDELSSIKCLLIGAGTVGCQVARMLMAWGVQKITLLDNGKVAMSNALRQSLYTLDDFLNGGDFKALAAAKSLKRIFPAVDAEGIVMSIPMPGHPMTSQEEKSVFDDCNHLHNLVDSHDEVFLLTDTRESR
ncbi:hypothetical protein SADUNF_Sadunf11G0042000 [Salix dunnii]|uniref:BHLH domain-containing protein n=1 Tax=Salix dunnii TaxID=1413687 RepID=A0A835MNY1_9ROSI|nr:hypothetical protein SADUNF_Sadunf11G0042000 [Salix dunnii]